MGILDSKLWMEDLDGVLARLPELGELEGQTVMVTGCTGLICSAVVDVLIRYNETHDEKIGIVAAGRSEQRVLERFAPHSHEAWFEFMGFDASFAGSVDAPQCDYIIHGASNASPSKIVKEPVETLLANVLGTKGLLDLAARQRAKRLLFVSSSEVYGKKEHPGPSKSDDHGWIDILSPRSSYSVGKCAAETLCASYCDEYGVDSVIVRPGHIYGPTALASDNRVSSAWAYATARGEDIVMKSDGAQIRSYCHCLDCASAIITVLLKGESLHAYNISNPASVISIKEMAEVLTSSAGVCLRMELPTEAERKAFNPMADSSLDGSDLLALGWEPLFDAERGFGHTVEVLKTLI